MSSTSEIRSNWLQFRNRVDAAHINMKDAQGALGVLYEKYKQLDPEERAAVTESLLEWLSSDDEGLRFDAEALIDEFRIKEAEPNLRELHAKLSGMKTPGAPFEKAKIDRIIARIAGVS